MIDHLRISGLGVIGEATVDLDPGFTVVTGETGAGKTMVVTALGLLLGARADAGAVRRGSSRAVVDAGVRVTADHAALRLAQEAGAVVDEGDNGTHDLVLSRSVTASGEGTRSRAAAGGRSVPVGLLSEIGATLVAVHGQNDQVRLQGADAQRHALDAFGGAELAAALRAYRADHAAWAAARREREELTTHRQERAREAEALQRSLEEIDLAEPREGEDEELRALIRRLEDVEELRAASGEAHARLAGPDVDAMDETPGAVSLVEGARQAVLAAPGDDPELAAAAARLAEVEAMTAVLGLDDVPEGDDAAASRSCPASAELPARTASCRAASAWGTFRSSSLAVRKAAGTRSASAPSGAGGTAPAARARAVKPSMRSTAASASSRAPGR